ncbi:MAG: hypothetical protein ACYDBB_22560 [Armatimonadota bacterium]
MTSFSCGASAEKKDLLYIPFYPAYPCEFRKSKKPEESGRNAANQKEEDEAITK